MVSGLLLSFGLRSQSIDIAKDFSYDKSDHDSSYIEVFPDYITSRVYFSQKITSVDFYDNLKDVELFYLPNTTFNLGVGATVNGFTLNLAYGFDFLNPDVGKGETRYLDLQSYTYTRHSVIEFFGQLYNGMYLDNTSQVLPDYEDPFYLRPDLRIRLFGLSYVHLFNGKKFSYAAPFVHNEFQKKSAGSWNLGGEISLVYTSADSSLIPTLKDQSLFVPFQGMDEVRYFGIGPKGGYAHSFILWKHFFITIAASVRLGIGPSRYSFTDGRVVEKWILNPSGSARFAIGYNSDSWYLGITAVQSTFRNAVEEANSEMLFGVGNVRMNYVKRFLMGPKTRNFVDKLPLP